VNEPTFLSCTDPLTLVGEWLDNATSNRVQRHPNAMTLATVDESSRPSARVVLIKNLSRVDGYATFFTHYESRKSLEIERNSHAAGVIHWDKLGRQIRFEGPIIRAPKKESDDYFATRPTGSQINAWVSAQSRSLKNERELERRAQDKMDEFGLTGGDGTSATLNPVLISRPPFWGGYRFWFVAIELWSEGRDRFHQRIRYERSLTPREDDNFDAGPWTSELLQP
jgi:pyridoxamine 5'-phosphate oxidase